MPPRPKGSLDDLTVPKGGDLPAPTVTTPAATPAVQGLKNYAHTLSLRLTADQYGELRSIARRIEDEQGGRATHQSIIEAALTDYFAKWKQ